MDWDTDLRSLIPQRSRTPRGDSHPASGTENFPRTCGCPEATPPSAQLSQDDASLPEFPTALSDQSHTFGVPSLTGDWTCGPTVLWDGHEPLLQTRLRVCGTPSHVRKMPAHASIWVRGGFTEGHPNSLTFGDPSFAIPTSLVAIPLTAPSFVSSKRTSAAA